MRVLSFIVSQVFLLLFVGLIFNTKTENQFIYGFGACVCLIGYIIAVIVNLISDKDD